MSGATLGGDLDSGGEIRVREAADLGLVIIPEEGGKEGRKEQLD